MNEIERQLKSFQPYDSEAESHRCANRERVQAAFERPMATTESSSPFLHSIDWRSVVRHPAFGLSAASLLAIGVLLISSLFAGAPRSAYAQLVEPLMKAKSGRFATVVRVDGKERMRQAAYFSGPMTRIEMKKGGRSESRIMDGESFRVLTLSVDASGRKSAILSSWPEAEGDQEALAKYGGGLLGSFRAALDPENKSKKGGKREPIERKGPDGRALKGFRLTRGDRAGYMEVLADAETGEPAELVMRVNAWPPGQESVLTDFDFEVEVDPDLFSLDPPEGYEFEDRTKDDAGD